MRPVDSNPQMGPGQTKKWSVKFPEWQVGREECVHSWCLLCLDLNHPNLRLASKQTKLRSPSLRMCQRVPLACDFCQLMPGFSPAVSLPGQASLTTAAASSPPPVMLSHARAHWPPQQACEDVTITAPTSS